MSRGYVHLFSQLECGAVTGGAPTTDPSTLSLAPPPGPFHAGEGRRILLDWVPTDRPFGRMSQQRTPD